MLAEDGLSNGSRRSTHKSTSPLDAEIPAIQGAGATGDAELPTIDDVVAEVYDKYPMKARTFLVDDAGDDPREARVKLREEVTERLEGGDALPVTWGGALRLFLGWLDEREGTRGRFRNGDGEKFEKELLNSYDPAYIERYYARLMGLARELVGGERPGGEWTAGEYRNPSTVLLALTSSGTYANGKPRAPVDHLLERREAWGPTYKRLYDRLEALVDEGRIRAWEYLVVDEHHAGGVEGLNAGLGHDHPLIVVDVVEGEELRPEDFLDVVDTWVEECPGAGWEAHDQRHPDPSKRPVQVRDLDPADVADPDVMNSIAGYVAKYLYPEGGDAHPLERDVEQLMHQTVKWATNTRRLRKSDGAGEAIRADRCRQAQDRDDQELGHGERLAHRAEGRGSEVVCAACGSSWGVDGAADAETIVEARRSADVDEHPGETGPKPQDSGTSLIKGGDGEQDTPGWREARAGASSAGWSFDRPPPTGWELEAVLIQDDDEPDGVREVAPSGGSSVEMVPVRGAANVGLEVDLDERRRRDERGDPVPEPEGPPPPDQLGRMWTGQPPPGDRYSQKGRRTVVRRAVRDLEGAAGAQATDVVDRVVDQDVDGHLAEVTIRSMLERGELYEPASGRLRVT